MTSVERSRIMRAVKGRDTKPEKLVRSCAHRMGYRFRLRRSDLPGKPDLVFPSRRAVVFVHGCFWHGHQCKRGARTPKTNVGYWTEKIARNKARDRENISRLKRSGWRALVIWECQLREDDKLRSRLGRFLN